MIRAAAASVVAVLTTSAILLWACGGSDGSGDVTVGSDGRASSSSGGSSSGGSTSSSSSGSSSGSTSSGGPSAACVTQADALCSWAYKCYGLLEDAFIGDLAECKERFGMLCDRESKAPGVAPIPAGCVATYQSLDCNNSDAVAASCDVRGTLANDTACEFDNQCASGYCTGDLSKCGVCKDRTPEHGSCSTAGQCVLTAHACIGGSCEKPRAKTEACTSSSDCARPLVCLGSTCSDALGEGAPCTVLKSGCDQTQLLTCRGGDGGANTGSCVKVTFLGPNAACDVDSGSCYGSSRCLGDAGAKTCVPKVDGMSCDSKEILPCRYGATCLDGGCAVPAADQCK